MITRRDLPLANCHPDEPAFCKWSSRWTGLLQMIIWMDRPLANDYPEGLASCKWLFRWTCLLQMIILRGQPLSNDSLDGPASRKWSSGWTGLLQMIIPRDCPLANDHPDQPDSSPSKPFYLLLQILGSMFNLNNVFLFIYGVILLSGHVRHRKLKNLKLFWQGQNKTSTFAVEKSMTWNYSMHKTLLKGRFITPGIRLLF